MAERVFTQAFVAVGAVIEKNGAVLLVREAGGDDRGKWNLPAGWIDVGENPLDMIAAEVNEETGLEFEPTALIGVYSLVKHYPHDEPQRQVRHVVKLYFRGSVTGGALIESNEEISECKWFTRSEIEESKFLRDKDIPNAVEDYFSGRNFPLDLIRHTRQN